MARSRRFFTITAVRSYLAPNPCLGPSSRAKGSHDQARLVVAGCSYGGIETLLASAGNLPVRAAVDFAGAAESWAGNQILQALLVAAVDRAQVPIFFLQAMNDYNTAPSLLLSAEMARVGKPYQVKIYPPYGTTVDDGHGGFCTNAADIWGAEVLTFLRTYIP
jgi:carboxymethylenebutenolidase